jgi:hypothetical protein
MKKINLLCVVSYCNQKKVMRVRGIWLTGKMEGHEVETGKYMACMRSNMIHIVSGGFEEVGENKFDLLYIGNAQADLYMTVNK